MSGVFDDMQIPPVRELVHGVQIARLSRDVNGDDGAGPGCYPPFSVRRIDIETSGKTVTEHRTRSKIGGAHWTHAIRPNGTLFACPPHLWRKIACSIHFRFLFKFTRTFTGPAMAVL